MESKSARKAIRSAGLLVSTSLVCASAFPAENSVTNHHADIGAMCGTKPMVVGLADGYGGNTWRKTALAELKDELSHCRNVTRFIYTNANGDQQKANSDINSMVAQGVNVLVMVPDFGAAQLPAIRAATRAGVAVVPYIARVPGTAGHDWVDNVTQDSHGVGLLWADWLGTNVRKGNVIFMGGTAGASTSQNFMDGLKAGLQKYPDLKLLNDQFIATNWNPADAQKATAGLIAKYPRIDAIVTDYGVTALAAAKAFEQANLPEPAIVTIGSNNELNCRFIAAEKSGKGFRYFTLDGTTSYIRFAARRAIAAYQGTADHESSAVLPFPFADSAKGLDPRCDPTAPPDADLSSPLPPEKLKAVLQQ
ncbi:substrate-binding domain-containing protein [Paraburkholderia fungorum]|uniref:substrate-binding domain-containing protein n=1 Tax=Paraburkholderia fungorum TaxID=134537 RepID=UPI0038B85C59